MENLFLYVFVVFIARGNACSSFSNQSLQVASLPVGSVVNTVLSSWNSSGSISSSVQVSLQISGIETKSYVSTNLLPVSSSERLFIGLSFSSSGLNSSFAFANVKIVWYNAQGVNLDNAYGQAFYGYFPLYPFTSSWVISTNGQNLFAADNVSVPFYASFGQIVLELTNKYATNSSITFSNISMQIGTVVPVGFDGVLPPNLAPSVVINAETGYSGGIIFSNDDGSLQTSSLNLSLFNSAPNNRQLTVNYTITDYQLNVIGSSSFSVNVCGNSFTKELISVANLKNGPYYIDYVIFEGGTPIYDSFTRFAIMHKKATSVSERGSIQYSFSLWIAGIMYQLFSSNRIWWGEMLDALGSGSTWFGVGDSIYLNLYTSANDTALIDLLQVAKSEVIPFLQQYGVNPMQNFAFTNFIIDSNQTTINLDKITFIVNSLKQYIRIWKWGTEYLAPPSNGTQLLLDQATDPSKPCGTYLGYCYPGTVRQYWQQYSRVYTTMKEADPNSIFGPGTADDPLGTVIQSYFAAGLNASQMDMFGMDQYFGNSWEKTVSYMRSQQMNVLMFAPEFADYTYFIGDPLNRTLRVEEMQNAYQMVNFHNEQIAAAGGQLMIDMDGMPGGLGPISELGVGANDITDRGYAKPVCVSYATMTEMLGAGLTIQNYTVYGSVNVFVRHRTIRPAIVTLLVIPWRSPNWLNVFNVTLQANTNSTTVNVSDAWGNLRSVDVINGTITVEASLAPTYVIETLSVPTTGSTSNTGSNTATTGNVSGSTIASGSACLSVFLIIIIFVTHVGG